MNPLVLDPARSASVSASAGTGKTWLLTSRILRLLLAGAEPGSILALTFTRKAAAEMRQRVNDGLRFLASCTESELDAKLGEIGLTSDPGLRQRARALHRAQLFNPHPLRATTLHAFAQDLISRFAFEAGVTPGFKLIESEPPLFRRAWKIVRTQILHQPQSAEARALMDLIGIGLSEQRLRELIHGFLQRRNDWRAFAPAAIDQWLYAELGIAEGEDADAAIRAPAFLCYLKELIRLLDRTEGVNTVKRVALETARDASAETAFERLGEAVLTQKGEARVFTPGKTFSEAQRKSLLMNHREVLNGIEAARTRRLAHATLKLNRAAVTLGCAALKIFDAELARQQSLCFAEIEWHALGLLQQDGAAEWVRYKLDQKISHLLVDEFQDTNPTQWRLLLPLLEEMSASDDTRSRSAFIVGDSKQSIFGFRRANSELLDIAGRWIQQRFGGVRETQTQTRRSAPALIDFINAHFGAARAAALQFETHTTTRVQAWGQVEVALPVERDDVPEAKPGLRDPLSQPRLERDETRAQREAQQVVERIQWLKRAHIEVADNHGNRRLDYGDILILARKRTHLIHLERALSRSGIPFCGSARGTLLETSEARDLMALLRFLDAPHRDLDLAQALRSPLFSLDDSMLIELARAVREQPRSWFAALADLAPGRVTLQRPLRLLTRWRSRAAQLPVHDLLDGILADANAAARYEAALPPAAAARVRANLGALAQLVLESDSGRYPSLSSFLFQVEERARAAQDAPDEAPPAAAQGQVRVLTIHAAKGLEAAAVFLVNAGFNEPNRTPPWLVEWPAEDARPSHFLASPARANRQDALSRRLLEALRQREQRENLNLLYVALTRARHFLHISGFVSGNTANTWHAQLRETMSALKAATLPLQGVQTGALAYGTGRAAVHHDSAIFAPKPVDDPRLRRPLALAAAAALPSGAPMPAMNPRAAERGAAIHYLLQQLGRPLPLSEARLRSGLANLLGRAVSDAHLRDWGGAAETVIAAPALAAFFDARRVTRFWNEVALCGRGGDGGIADRIVDDGETLWIVDYKTSESPDAAQMIERYRGQMSAYLNAAREIWPGRALRAALVFTATCEWAEVTA